ncbi:aminoglycoside phosphotransferase family protein [Acidiferrimicrobium sp. IK]|uniref:phosphotransferase family protein n=1 Tax=Acidiferrimicrobium sp. IK TaxID=2871700 RepID=UPI0021CB2419|nr:aminoglycoside phosphotransferase family protein [Acidiferrimicrobium sp. IK]MCU4186190.1 aminoglycoside phosphotransferase family protein [Acidiferrimicrobium sp. IK]
MSSTRVAVLKLGPPGGDPIAVLKVPSSLQGALNQRRAAAALAQLWSIPALEDFVGLLPRMLAAETIDGQEVFLERALPGVEASRAARGSAERLRLLAEAGNSITALHACTNRRLRIEDPILDQWIDRRLATVASVTRRQEPMERLGQRLRGAWGGRTESVSWVHGDYWLGNVLTEPVSGSVSGIVDWEWAGDLELAAHDTVYLLLHDRMQAQHRELGEVVADLLKGQAWLSHEQAILRSAGLAGDDVRADNGATLLLVWLRQIAYNLMQDHRIGRNFIWVHRNIDCVLRAV